MILKDILNIVDANTNIQIRDTEHFNCLNEEEIIFYGEPQDYPSLVREEGNLNIVGMWVKDRTLVLEASGVKKENLWE